MNRLRSVLIVCSLLTCWSVWADEPRDVTRRADAARQHFKRGQAHFSAGDHAAAIREFDAGYALSPQPLFLYNIALCNRLSGKLERALDYYRRYIAVAPRAPERPEVEARIADLERALATPTPAVTPAPAVTPTPTPVTVAATVTPARPRGRAMLWSGAAVAVLGGISLAIGGTFTGLAARADDQLDHPTPGSVFDPALQERRDRYGAAGISLLAVGGALALVGITVTLLGSRAARRGGVP